MAESTEHVQKFTIFSVLRELFSILFRRIIPYWAISIILLSPIYTHFYYKYDCEGYYTKFECDSYISDYVDSILIIFYAIFIFHLLVIIISYGFVWEFIRQSSRIENTMLHRLRGIFRVIGIAFVMGLSWLVPIVALFGVVYFFTVNYPFGSAWPMLGSLAAAIAGFYFAFLFWTAVPAATMEGRFIPGFSRSLFLSKGYRGAQFIIVFLIVLLVTLLHVAGWYLARGIGSDYHDLVLIYWIVNALGISMSAVVVVVCYCRLRAVKEGRTWVENLGQI